MAAAAAAGRAAGLGLLAHTARRGVPASTRCQGAAEPVLGVERAEPEEIGDKSEAVLEEIYDLRFERAVEKALHTLRGGTGRSVDPPMADESRVEQIDVQRRTVHVETLKAELDRSEPPRETLERAADWMDGTDPNSPGTASTLKAMHYDSHMARRRRHGSHASGLPGDGVRASERPHLRGHVRQPGRPVRDQDAAQHQRPP